MEPAVCGMFRDPDPSRSGGRGPPLPSDRSILPWRVRSSCTRMAD